MAPKKSKSTSTKAKNRRLVPPRTEEDPWAFIPIDPAILALVNANQRVSADDPRGTKRSATVADEPNEDQGDSESEPQKSVSPVARRVRFQSPLVSQPKQRRRIDDDNETAEVAPDEMWVAEGEVGSLQ
jgi:hypothetical protein